MRPAILILFSLLLTVTAAAQTGSPGTARIKMSGNDFAVEGEYPATLCGGPFMMGKGMAYQVKAGEYQITIASETRSTGVVPLNLTDGNINVMVTISGKGRSLVRHPANGGKLTISDDYKKAEASLEVRPVVGRGTASLNATFICQ